MKTASVISSSGSDSREGFTLAELAVVVATVAVLALLCVPMLANTKGESRIVQCNSNLKQYCLALQMFGNENNDKLPVNDGGYWAWDLGWGAGNSITQYVSFRKLYCPGTSVRFTDLDNSNLWNYAPGSLHVPGYVAALPGSMITATNQNTTLTPQRIQGGTALLPAPSPSARILVADGTISGSQTDNQAGFRAGAQYNFVSVRGGYTVAHISPHLNGTVPAGGNLGMLDGHVQWRKFADMDERASASGSAGFWW